MRFGTSMEWETPGGSRSAVLREAPISALWGRSERCALVAAACFEYVGRTSLVLRGSYTGRRYWFKQPGARQWVDTRDCHTLSAVPVLRVVA